MSGRDGCQTGGPIGIACARARRCERVHLKVDPRRAKLRLEKQLHNVRLVERLVEAVASQALLEGDREDELTGGDLSFKELVCRRERGLSSVAEVRQLRSE